MPTGVNFIAGIFLSEHPASVERQPNSGRILNLNFKALKNVCDLADLLI